MMQRARMWWSLRSSREQRLLLVMAALFAVVIAWLLIFRPLGDVLADARNRHQNAVIALGKARAQAGDIAALERIGPPQLDVPVNVFVGQRASEAGFTVERVEPQGAGSVRIVIAAVRPQAFFAWAASLERQYGLVVDGLAARTNSDRTLSVEATFRARDR